MEKYITYMCLHGIPVYANVVFGIYNFSAFFFHNKNSFELHDAICTIL